MLIEVLKSKLQCVIVTEANINYKGSITIDPELMKAAHMVPYEKVEVNNSSRKSRINTYIIPGKPGSGEICLNGGAAQYFQPGDKVHILAFGYCTPEENRRWEVMPTIVYTDDKNKVTNVKGPM